MNDTELMLLQTGRNLRPCVVEVDGMTDQQIREIQILSAEGLIESFGPYGGYRITEAGIRTLRSEEETREQRSQQKKDEDASKREERSYLDQQTKKQFRHDWRVAAFEVFGGFVLGAIADHFFDIVSYCSGFLGSLFK